MDVLIQRVSARTVMCMSGNSGGAYRREWLPRTTRSSVDPERAGERMNTGARSIRSPVGGGRRREGCPGGRVS